MIRKKKREEMPEESKSRIPRMTLKRQLSIMVATVLLPFLIMTGVLIYMLASFNQQYTESLHNANVVSELSSEFKVNMDSDMYYYVARGEEELPMQGLNNARRTLKSLQQSTQQRGGQWRFRGMLNLCDRLEEFMIEVSETEEYDKRLEIVETEVYNVTSLIDSYLQECIQDEIRELSDVRTRINEQVYVAMMIVFMVSVGLLMAILFFVWRFSRSVTYPIKQLCDKAERLGVGDLTVVPIKTNNKEFKTLDDGFNEMIYRITNLLNQVKEDQTALHKTELELLQAQINPHFLYNTFDSIIWLAEAKRNDEVVQMVSSLSTFFRNSLNKGQDIITVEAEAEQVKSYLNIQKIRYSDILEYEISIDDDIKEYQLPKLSLQPLVENAIYHGIKNKRGGGKLWIRGYSKGDYLILSVRDNGTGIPGRELEVLRDGVYEDHHTGLGLINVHKRIKLYCGEAYGLTFESVFGEGTTVSIRLPKDNQLLS